jgi:hypothetical protein
MLRHFTLAVLMSLALILSGIASAEDNAEPPVSQNANDPAFADKQLVDPVAIEKMAADVRQVPLTEDMVNRFIASFKGMREVAKTFPNTKLPDSVIDEVPGSELKHMPEDKRAAMTEVATANGFKDLEEWSVVGSSIAMSYTYALQGKKPGELSKAIIMHISEVKETPSSTPSRKKRRLRDWRILGRSLVDWSLCRRITLWSST